MLELLRPARDALALLVVVLAIWACSPAGSPAPADAAATPRATPGSWVTSPSIEPSEPLAGIPEALRDQPTTTARVGEQTLRVVVAQDHARGLMGIDDLGSLDGMLFEMPDVRQPSVSGWWMRNVPIPLDIAFFDAGARLIEIQRMEPCRADPCQVYHASAPYRWALETEVGTLRARPGDLLQVDALPSPSP